LKKAGPGSGASATKKVNALSFALFDYFQLREINRAIRSRISSRTEDNWEILSLNIVFFFSGEDVEEGEETTRLTFLIS